MKPEFARALIRQANRERFNSTEVKSLLDFSETILAIQGETQDDAAVTVLTKMWKDSFNEP
jgi:hypothetical protein